MLVKSLGWSVSDKHDFLFFRMMHTGNDYGWQKRYDGILDLSVAFPRTRLSMTSKASEYHCISKSWLLQNFNSNSKVVRTNFLHFWCLFTFNGQRAVVHTMGLHFT